MKEGIISNLTEIKSITKEYYEQLYANDLDNLKEVLVAQSCPTLWDPMDCSQPVSSVYGILQSWILEWVAIKFLERNELSNLHKKKTENLTKPISKEIELVIKNLSHRIAQAQISSLTNSIEHIKSNQFKFFTNFSKN